LGFVSSDFLEIPGREPSLTEAQRLGHFDGGEELTKPLPLPIA
jgi:hypothetical protein